MKWITFALTIATLAGLIAYKRPASGQGDGDAAPIYGIKIPPGYRDWRMISIADVGAPVSDLRVKLGNDVAIKAYRDDKRPFPDGTIIARLAYRQVTSEENNKVFRAAAGNGIDASLPISVRLIGPFKDEVQGARYPEEFERRTGV